MLCGRRAATLLNTVEQRLQGTTLVMPSLHQYYQVDGKSPAESFQGHDGEKGTGFMQNEKDINLEGDVVLIYYQDEPSVYARIEAVEPDVKKDWYRVTLLMLTIPPQTATWILREEYFNGAPFTMGGEPLRIEGVARAYSPAEPAGENVSPGKEPAREPPSKVIPLHKKRT